MALFKISKGEKTNLPITYNEGYCYVTTDENKMYIDYEGKGGTSGTRVCLNAANADTIDHYTSNDLVKVNDSLLTTNPFGGKKLYISKLDNSLYAADKRWETSFTVYNEATNEIISTQDCSVLFNGYYDEDYSMCSFESGQYAILRINFGNNYHNTYSYGHYYLSFYDNAIPGEVTARGYCNFSGHGIGWKDFTISYLNQENKTNYIVDIYNSSFQNISQLEITIKFPASTNNARVRCTELEFKPNRPDYNRQPIVSKYLAETLYYPLTAPSFIGNLTGNASTATLLQTTRTINGTDFNGGKDIETSYWGAAKLLKVGYKEISVNGNSHVTWDLHDILLNTNSIGTASSWDVLNSGVYSVASADAFTGTGNPESANGGLAPYRYGQLIVSRAGTSGLAQFYISHNDSNTSQKLGIKYRTGWNNAYVDTWESILDTSNFNNYAPTLTGTGATGTWGISITGNAATATALGSNAGSTTQPIYFSGGKPVACGTSLAVSITGNAATATTASACSGNAATATKLATAQTISLTGDVTGSASFTGNTACAITATVADNSHNHTWSNISDRASCTIKTSGTITGSKVYGAVWNDYAEYRTQKEIVEPGYCVTSADNGQVYKTTEKFQACDGIVSDTFGFAIGETDKCKTPLAVAGRVLAYCEGNRNDYHSGDTVCAGPEGKVMKMTREEIREWPDRIIGIVSEIPKYETWGTGNVPVNGRIWIKIK